MKRTYLIIICMMAAVMSSHAQQPLNLTGLKGAAMDNYLATPTNKANLIGRINGLIKKSVKCAEMGMSVTDVFVEKSDSFIASNMAKRLKALHKAPHRASILDASDAVSYHVGYKYTYYSVNAKNQKVRLSGMIYVENEEPDSIEFGILSCHPTVSTNVESPTGSDAPEAAIHAMCDENCIVVCPDYCGYGVSANEQHPYLIQDVTARNCLDGYVAAIAYAKDVLNFKFCKSFYSYFLGYSQGGSVAMACQRYYEYSDNMTFDDKNFINLRETFCGDGPYSAYATIDQYVQWANSTDEKYQKLAYPSVLSLIMLAAKDAYDNDCMHTIDPADCFNKDFLEKTGCMDAIKKKISSMAEINDMIWAQGFYTIDQMLSDKIITKVKSSAGKDSLVLNTETNECKCLLRAFSKNNLIGTWAPLHAITVFHFKDDLVVPYANSEKLQAFSSAYYSYPIVSPFRFVDAEKAYQSGGDALYDFLSWFKSTGGSDTSQWDHVSVGTLFYVWFMFGNAREFKQEALAAL